MSDKLAALLPRPDVAAFKDIRHAVDALYKHMDAQDALIAELEREIREARLMLLQAFQHRNDCPAWGTACKEWLSRTERNAERENGQ